MTYAAPGASSFWCVVLCFPAPSLSLISSWRRFFTPSDAWYSVTRYFKRQFHTEIDFEEIADGVQQLVDGTARGRLVAKVAD